MQWIDFFERPTMFIIFFYRQVFCALQTLTHGLWTPTRVETVVLGSPRDATKTTIHKASSLVLGLCSMITTIAIKIGQQALITPILVSSCFGLWPLLLLNLCLFGVDFHAIVLRMHNAQFNIVGIQPIILHYLNPRGCNCGVRHIWFCFSLHEFLYFHNCEWASKCPHCCWNFHGA